MPRFRFGPAWALGVVLAAGACGAQVPAASSPDPNLPVADECPPAPGEPTVATGTAPSPRDLTVPLDAFPLCGFRVTDEGADGETGWHRRFTPLDPRKANFTWVIVYTFAVGDGEASRFIAGHTVTTFAWPTATATVREVTAEVVGDGAKAFVADFGAGVRPHYLYVTGVDGIGAVVETAPSRSGVDVTLAMARLVSVAKQQLAFAGRVLAAARPSPTPPPAPLPARTPGSTPRPAGEPFVFLPPSELPGATAGVEYSFSFCVPRPATATSPCGPMPPTVDPTGGQPPYHFQLGALALVPLGLSLGKDGIFSGIPAESAIEVWRFEVCAVDLGANTVCREVALRLRPPALARTPPPATEAPLEASAKITSRTCAVRRESPDGTRAYWVDLSGTASGPVNTSFGVGTSYLVETSCGAWGRMGVFTCSRRQGDPPTTQWTIRVPAIGSSVTFSVTEGGSPRSSTAVSMACP